MIQGTTSRRDIPMSACVVVVHDDPNFCISLTVALRVAGCEVAAYSHPHAALAAPNSARPIELVLTRVRFPSGKGDGVSLALSARYRRPDIKVLFLALPAFAEYVTGLGEFIAAPAEIEDIVGYCAAAGCALHIS
jgi:DNA-binding NtrC family response regulator